MKSKRIMIAAMALVAVAAYGMPTKESLDAARPLVGEAMRLPVERFKKGRIGADEVAYSAMRYAGEAKLPEEQFLLLRGAVNYFARAGQFEAAADVIENSLLRIFGEISGEALYEITSKAAKDASGKTATRLLKQNTLAKKLVDVERELAAKPGDATLKRSRCEILFCLKGEYAIGEFAALGGDFARMAEPDPMKDPSRSNVDHAELGKRFSAYLRGMGERADFWWDYECAVPEAKEAIRRYAADCYSKTVDRLGGEKKALAVKRMNEFGIFTKEQSLAKEQEKSQKSGTKAYRTESLMKLIRIPVMSFKPPATLADAVDFFNKAAKEYDLRTDVPDEKKGVKIVLKMAPSDKPPTLMRITAIDISLYEAVKLVSEAVRFKMRIDGDTVVIHRE